MSLETRHSERSDLELVRTAREDPESASARRAACALLERYQGRVYAWCFRHVRDHDRAMELAQDTLLRAYQGLSGFQERGPFSGWLFMIARNRCRSALRPVPLGLADDIDPDTLAASSASTRWIETDDRPAEEILGWIRKALDPLEQEVLWLRCFERMPVEEITRTLSIPETSGARAVLQRARRKLRTALAAAEEGSPT